MGRRSNISKAEKRKRRRKNETEAARFDALVRDTAATFTCSADIVGDFAYQCESRRDQVECDLAFNRLALEMWHDRPGWTDLANALEAFAAERQRHLDALTELGTRFASIAADPSRAEQHEHLDPVEDYHELVRSRILPDRA